MPWWGYVIIAGVIFVCVTLILIWIIVASNTIVILRKKVDRNFPLMNTKIKEYVIYTEKLLDLYKKKVKKETRAYEHFKKSVEELKETEGIFARETKTFEVAEKFKSFVKSVKKEKTLDDNRKFNEVLENIEKNQNEIVALAQKYNLAAQKYNETIHHFPTRMIAERFKFYDVNYFQEKQ